MALSLSLSLPAAADIYKYVDKHGRVILTDKPENAQYKRLVRTWKGWEEQKSRIATEDFYKNRERYTSTINYYANLHRISHALLHAVITAESAYDPNAISRAGAVGMMQLMPTTAKRFGVQNRRNPSDNINGGTRYLVELLQMFNNDLTLALAAYNSGENTVKEYGYKVPPYKETRNYIRKVIEYYTEYKKKMPS
jgi:soluble lytic murein transglycosylase-like protein